MLVALLLAPSAQAWEIRPDPAFGEAFQRSSGWLGADGAYSVKLRGPWSGWLFSDTFVGSASDRGALLPGYRFLHNSWARFSLPNPHLALFSENSLVEARREHWYWVSQPVLDEHQRGYLFLGEFGSAPGPEGLNFAQTGSAVAPLDWRGEAPKVGKPVSIPHFRPEPAPVHFGAAALREGDWLYLYGTRDFHTRRELLLARAPWSSVTEARRWQFWAGSQWQESLNAASVLVPETSNELSVYRYGPEYRLLHQVGKTLWLHRASRPEGPWSERVALYETPEEPPIWTYNGKAHPEFVDEEGGMLITYNCNAMPAPLVLEDIDRYRPRCLRLYGDPWLKGSPTGPSSAGGV